MAITRDYVDWADGQIHYRLGGEGPGAPLVLLHQTAGSSAMYQSLMEILQGHYRLIALDTPGFGQSDFPPPDPTVGYYAAALLEALQNLGVDRFHAFGFHTGASIACEMAVVAPERVESIMLCGPPYANAEERAQWKSKVTGAAEKREDFRNVGVGPMVIQPDGSHLTAIWKRLQDIDPQAAPAIIHRDSVDNLSAGERYHEAVLAVFDHDLPAALARVRCPILLLCGERDILYPYLQPACDARPDAKCVTVPGGAYLVDEEPQPLAGEIQAFLDGLAAAS